jgi:hypothetical protein
MASYLTYLWRQAGGPPLARRPADSTECYGLMAKLRVVQPALVVPPPAASIELPHTWPVVRVVGEAGSGLAPE